MVEKIQGFAIVVNDEINIATVSKSRRAAIVNWLVIACRQVILSTTTDEEIEKFWERHQNCASVVVVNIELPENVLAFGQLTEFKSTISDKEIDKWIDYGLSLGHDDPRKGFKEVLDTIINGGFLTLKDWTDHREAMKY